MQALCYSPSRSGVYHFLTRERSSSLLHVKDLHERIGEVFGSEVAEHLVHIGPMQEDGCRIHGRVSPPGIGRPTRQDIVTVVNGRPVESRTLLYALTEAYHTLIPKGKYPAAFLFVEIDPALIDVNIHPQKREIRFRSGWTH